MLQACIWQVGGSNLCRVTSYPEPDNFIRFPKNIKRQFEKGDTRRPSPTSNNRSQRYWHSTHRLIHLKCTQCSTRPALCSCNDRIHADSFRNLLSEECQCSACHAHKYCCSSVNKLILVLICKNGAVSCSRMVAVR